MSPKEFTTLHLLVEAGGNAVERDFLIRSIWPDTVVGDTSLGRNVSVLRKHLGTEAIEAIPKFGYRFTLPVTIAEPGSTDPKLVKMAPDGEPSPVELGLRLAPRTAMSVNWRWLLAGTLVIALAVSLVTGERVLAWRRASLAGYQRLAVLPFQNLSATGDGDYLRDGIADELTARLGRLNYPQLRVLSTRSTRQYLNTSKSPGAISDELNAQYLLEGSVLFHDGRAELTVNLVNGPDQTIAWSRQFSRPADDLAAVEEEIVEAIASNPAVSGRRAVVAESTSVDTYPPAAHDEYLRGRYELEQGTFDGYQQALGHFEKAIQMDGQYAKAYAGLAETYIFLGGILPEKECFPKARKAALAAIRLDASLSAAHRDLGYLLVNDEGDLRSAEMEYKQAIALNPDNARAHHWYAQLLTAERRNVEAVSEATTGFQLDPRSTGSGSNYGFMLVDAGQVEAGIKQLQAVVARDPKSDYTWGYIGFGYIRLGQYEAAARAFEQAAALGTLKVNYLACAAYARARAGDTAPTYRVLEMLKDRERTSQWVPAQSMAILELGLKNHDEANKWLLRGVEDRTITLFEANNEPFYSELKDDPKFAALLAGLARPK